MYIFLLYIHWVANSRALGPATTVRPGCGREGIHTCIYVSVCVCVCVCVCICVYFIYIGSLTRIRWVLRRLHDRVAIAKVYIYGNMYVCLCICICICICMYVCMYVCICVSFISIGTLTCVRRMLRRLHNRVTVAKVYMYICVYIYMYIHIYLYICMYVCKDICMCVYIYLYLIYIVSLTHVRYFLAFTRYSFVSRLLCTNQSYFLQALPLFRLPTPPMHRPH